MTFDAHQVKGLVDRNHGATLIEDASTEVSLMISSVGQETVKGKACRWIEFQTRENINGQMQSLVFKLLIPEE